MNLGIDISQIVYEGTGVARFTKGLTHSILNLDKDNRWTFFFSSFRRSLDPEIEKKISAKGHKLIKLKLPPTLLAFLWNDLHYASKFLNFNFGFLTSLDWFITSDWTEPNLLVKKATIVHDLVFLRYPETVHQKILSTQEKRLNLVKKESDLVFADSESTKNDLISLLKIDSKKIVVNYPGVEVKKPINEQIKTTLKKYNLNRPFILTVGKLEPRKNISNLIKAFTKLVHKNIDLVIVGAKGWDTIGVQSIKRLDLLSNNANIKYLGFVAEEELSALYSSCLLFAYPSIWEGFGYPLVEAMRLGAPVATSNTSSLAEIAKDSALLFDPTKVDDITDSVKKLIGDEKLRKDLIKKAYERSKMFTWENYYKKLISVFTKH